MGITFKFHGWGDPIKELLKLLQEDAKRIKDFRRHCDGCENTNLRGKLLRAEYRGRYEAIRDVIYQIHIIRNDKRGRRPDGRLPFKPTDDEQKLREAQFFAMAAMHESGQGRTETPRFLSIMMDRPYLEKMAEITKEQYERIGGDGSALEKWGILGIPHD